MEPVTSANVIAGFRQRFPNWCDRSDDQRRGITFLVRRSEHRQ